MTWYSGIEQMRKFVAEKTIDPVDFEKLYIGDDPNEVAAHVTGIAMKKFGLSYGAKMRKRWWLWE